MCGGAAEVRGQIRSPVAQKFYYSNMTVILLG